MVDVKRVQHKDIQVRWRSLFPLRQNLKFYRTGNNSTTKSRWNYEPWSKAASHVRNCFLLWSRMVPQLMTICGISHSDVVWCVFKDKHLTFVICWMQRAQLFFFQNVSGVSKNIVLSCRMWWLWGKCSVCCQHTWASVPWPYWHTQTQVYHACVLWELT